MAASRVGRSCLYRRHPFTQTSSTFDLFPHHAKAYRSRAVQQRLGQARAFRTNRPCREEYKQQEKKEAKESLGSAWRKTKVQWKPIPIGLGIIFLGLFQLWRIQRREERAQQAQSDSNGPRPPKRQRIYPSGGGWQVQVMSTLPLKAISRIWGRFNELTIPYYLRVPGFKLYGWIFGVNFDEVAEPDLRVYPNLAAFFYRQLKPGVRPLDPNFNAILSPADAKILQFGHIDNGEVEQVKGMTYSLDALLGTTAPSTPNPQHPSNIFTQSQSSPSDARQVRADEEFANVNGISYTLPNLFSGSQQSTNKRNDQSTLSSAKSEAAVAADLSTTSQPWWSPFSASSPSSLYYIVVYLAPGDYHRFHSPVSWICTTRRHFAGELYSVSPYVQRTLPGLFTLNERVVLLGNWKYGFFSYTPVGATNVGSIKINFDNELRTNSLTTDTEADRQAAQAQERGEAYSGFSEASYEAASKVLGGHALQRGEEMGGFQLGSSIVLVFEAPGGEGWKWCVEKGQRVKVGEALGYVDVKDDAG